MPQKQKTKRSPSVKSRIHRHVKLALVPHKANQYRPHAIRRYGIAVIIAIVFVMQAVYNGAVGGDVLGTQAQVTSAGLLSATNEARAQQGEPPLTTNDQLNQAAQLKVRNMFADQYWAHNAPDGTTPWHWFGVVGYAYAEAGENLAKNFTTSDSTVSAWMASPEHRANILKADYSDVGFATMDGVLDGKATSITVALYGTPDTAVKGVAITTDAPSINGILTPVTRLSLGLQSLTPAAVSSLMVLASAASLALIAHLYRKQLPSKYRRSWYRHHGIYKAIGFASLAIVVVFMYGGTGQI